MENAKKMDHYPVKEEDRENQQHSFIKSLLFEEPV